MFKWKFIFKDEIEKLFWSNKNIVAYAIYLTGDYIGDGDDISLCLHLERDITDYLIISETLWESSYKFIKAYVLNEDIICELVEEHYNKIENYIVDNKLNENTDSELVGFMIFYDD